MYYTHYIANILFSFWSKVALWRLSFSLNKSPTPKLKDLRLWAWLFWEDFLWTSSTSNIMIRVLSGIPGQNGLFRCAISSKKNSKNASDFQVHPKKKKEIKKKGGKWQTKQRNAFDNTITHTGRRNKIYVCIPSHDHNLYS